MSNEKITMERCSVCTLPSFHPKAELDENKVCKSCRGGETQVKNEDMQNMFKNEDEFISALEPFRNSGKKYDVCVPLSGGVDSSFALIQIVKKFKLKPLVFHNDNGFEDKVATDNVRKLCAEFDLDLVLWQHDFGFQKKLWRHLNNSNIAGASACYFCANIIYANALQISKAFDVPLMLAGYSKGQAEILEQKKRGVDVLAEYLKYLDKNDPEFRDEFLDKYKIMGEQRVLSSVKDFENGPTDKILAVPFFLFKFYKTDKKVLETEIRKHFDWQPMEDSYPARTTNCKMIWLNTYVDKQKFGYSVYDEEYAGMVRSGDMTPEQALEDLAKKPPEGLIQELADKVGYDLNRHANTGCGSCGSSTDCAS